MLSLIPLSRNAVNDANNNVDHLSAQHSARSPGTHLNLTRSALYNSQHPRLSPMVRLFPPLTLPYRLRRLLEELDSRIRAIPSDTFANEATCSAYVCSFLTQAILIFNSELTLAPERSLRGRHGHGKVDYAIEALAQDGSRHVLGVTEVKREDYGKGLAQNLVQLESSLTVRKRKRSCDDNGDGEREEDSSAPMRAYGIVTDASFWFFVECTIKPSQDSGDRPKFRISRLDDIVNYNKSTWREEAASLLGQIVWLMRKMHSEIPGRELQLKKQKFTTFGQSSPPTGKVQRV